MDGFDIVPGEIHRNAAQRVNRGDFQSSAKLYKSLLAKDENDLAARAGLAESLLGFGELASAEEEFAKLSTNVQTRPIALQGIGIARLRQGDIDGGESALNAAVTEDQSLWRAWNALARVHDLNGDRGGAADAYAMALKYSPTPAIVHNNIGYSLVAQQRYAEAVEEFDRALQIDPTLEVAEVNRLLNLAMQERYDEAVFDSDSEDAIRALNNAGYIALIKQDYATAEKFFVRALQQSPKFYPAAYENLQVLAGLKEKKKR
jgi:Tfp pilus assembly protein PilF